MPLRNEPHGADCPGAHTSTGVDVEFRESSPSSPSALLPHVHTFPVDVSAIDVVPAADTAMTFDNPAIGSGVSEAPPLEPSWPWLFEPHAHTVPSLRAAKDRTHS